MLKVWNECSFLEKFLLLRLIFDRKNMPNFSKVNNNSQ